ncbi:MAG: 2-oxo acid dehydrogenase subunit E2 [Firmicutes bacterium]|jgi:pyruvate/2-oxoglutarate dehydrogenase complex dihydrolipoamide acyltransferase (E2) component|nr:2-oxo acid dehydrogenase subunit E2 [Bacillota bacterium]
MEKLLFPKERRHTLHFLSHMNNVPLFYLSTEVKIPFSESYQPRIPWTAIVASGVAKVLKEHPGANASFAGKFSKYIIKYQDVAIKFTVDRTVNNVRVVLSAVLPKAERMSVKEIEEFLYRVKNDDVADVPEFGGAIRLQKAPFFIGKLAFSLAIRNIKRRQNILGTVAISTLGRSPIKSFFGYGGTALTFGIGQAYKISDEFAVDGGSYMLPLSLTVDHRIVDGAEAAAILEDMHDAIASIITLPEAYHAL